MNAQAAAANEQVKLLVRQLQRHGTDVKVYRCHETAPSESMASLIGLDRADPEATKALIQHGAEDATTIVQEIQQKTPNGQILEQIFERAANLTKNQQPIVTP